MLQYPNGSIDSICEDDYYSICDKGYSLPELVSLLPEPLIEPSLFIEENETNKPMSVKSRKPMTLKSRKPKSRKSKSLRRRNVDYIPPATSLFSQRPVPTSARSI